MITEADTSWRRPPADSRPLIPTVLPTSPVSRRDETDVIIIGSGAAGMSAALPLLDSGRRVTMITKGRPGDGSTAWAQGGLAAVLAPTDSLRSHLEDTLTAGAGLCDAETVAELVAAAPGTIERLTALGARFDLDDHGRYALGLEGGHHARRIVHAGGDASGAEVARTLATRVLSLSKDSKLELREQTTVVDLLTDDHGITGVRVIDSAGRIGEIAAPAVILAAGGIGQAWETTTNPATATGDGVALALRAGAVIRDLEFVQFHPTVLVVPEDHRRPGDRGVLISEAVRGEGARLVDRRGTLIMDGKHPLGDLAPRDVVASAMHTHLMDTGDDHLFLDGTMLGEQVWRQHFPTILELCQARGVDPITEPIPVRPAEHYSCGGVLAGLDGRTTVPGLYAVGEVASTGVQGANRLASNSLTEAVIAGNLVGSLLTRGAAERGDALTHALEASSGCASLPDEFQTPDPPRAKASPRSARAGRDATSAAAVGNLENHAVVAGARAGIVSSVSRGAGVQRDEAELVVLLKSLGEVELSERAVGVAEVEATNLYTVAVAVATAAVARAESRGCHRRADYPGPDPAWRRHSLLRLGADGLEITHSDQIADSGEFA
ncbi:L-aspartate oxidase [Microlunatus elymi]|uniref:L-aspartate oxidase n=1 Tax=Microlunatus elymi TaxID=2596828 RepID=A0A516Q473_9ACTN|nr:L-aspartate oxidase [Microlunatus elymi]QDP98011.1 L-aspartate oxidase [Microlunatus elymi]